MSEILTIDSSKSEACLYLNVWAPNTGTGLPVFVWLHGGSRSATDPGLDGSKLAQQGNIIVITIE
jgi:carboxylesterase type B